MAEALDQLKWSSAYKLASAQSSPAQTLQGDKILLPPSALEALLEAAPNVPSSDNHTFTAFDPSNPYSVAAAQHERSLYRSTSQHLPNPLMFRLRNQRSGNVVYAGIREFSAQEGSVVLSAYLRDALGVKEGDIPPATSTNGKGTNGVIDLTSDDDAMALDAPDEGVRISITAHQLPKGTYVRLRPLEAGYNPDDWKSLLERQLRSNYTTLTKDTILSVRGPGSEEFRLLVDKFAPEGDGICVVDTDLEVDIEALNEEQARETMKQIAARAQKAPGTEKGSSVGGKIDVWKSVDGRVLEGEYVDYELPSWDRARALEVELSVQDGEEVDLFVTPRSSRQRAVPREDEYVFGDVSSPKDGVKRIVIQPTNVALEDTESLMISVHGFKLPDAAQTDARPRRFALHARNIDQNGTAADPIDLDGAEQHAGEEQCSNCLQWIPAGRMFLHQNFCLRNNVLCPHCKEVFQKTSPEWAAHWHCPHHMDVHGDSAFSKAKHDYIYHTPHPCPACTPSSEAYRLAFTFDSLPQLAEHRTTICPSHEILCGFCHLVVPQEGDPLDPSEIAQTQLTGLTAHERADGARTTDCHLCGKIIRLRDMAAHLAHHELDRATRAKPEICRDELCGRTLHGVGSRGQVGSATRMGQGPGNELGLCSLCFGPLYVSMHDPEGKALRRRIERRYLGQLMTGCGHGYCANEFCKTGRNNIGLDPLPSSSSGALPIVKPLLAEIGDKSKQMHFCVDEATQKRKRVAEMLAAEGGWELEWCVAACEAEGADPQKARAWLGDWAPPRTVAR
jgi:hypothetical protein